MPFAHLVGMHPHFKLIASAALFSLTIFIPGFASDPTQNGTPGAQGTEGTNPTHQAQTETGVSGEHTSSGSDSSGTNAAPNK